MLSGEISLKQLFLKVKYVFFYILSKWYIVLAMMLLGLLCGYYYSKVKKPLFTATTTFVLESNDAGGGGLSQYAGMAAMVGIDLGGNNGGIFQGDNLLELYKSRKMIEAALLRKKDSVSNISLFDYYLSITKERDSWMRKDHNLLKLDFNNSIQSNVLLQRQRDSILSKTVLTINRDILKVDKLDKKLSIIKIDVTSEDEVFSKAFNEALVSEVNDFYIQTKTKKSIDNIHILQYKTDSVRSVMNGAISVAAFTIDNTPNLNPTKQAQRIIPSQKSQFSAETNKAILSSLVQNLEMSKMALLKETPLIQIVDSPIYPLKKAHLGALKGSIIGILLGFICSILVLLLYKGIKIVLQG